MRIVFATCGKIKSKECAELFQYYLKLSSKFGFKIEHATLEKSKKHLSYDSALKETIKTSGTRFHLTILDERGKTFNSRAFAEYVEKKIIDASFNTWIIACGAEHGFNDELTSTANLKLSISTLTLPHELAAVVCAEQIFRCFSIIKGHPYHND